MRIKYRTDAVSGEMEATSLKDALQILDEREGIMDTLDDGAWAWVEDERGNRLRLKAVEREEER